MHAYIVTDKIIETVCAQQINVCVQTLICISFAPVQMLFYRYNWFSAHRKKRWRVNKLNLCTHITSARNKEITNHNSHTDTDTRTRNGDNWIKSVRARASFHHLREMFQYFVIYSIPFRTSCCALINNKTHERVHVPTTAAATTAIHYTV